MSRPLRYALFGDGESPHLAKWIRALAPRTELWVASSRGLRPEVAHLVPPERLLLLQRRSAPGGGNAAMLAELPRLARWLHAIDADWINPHYLTSHGLLAWLSHGRALAPLLGRPLRARLLGSAWGSDILVTPERNLVYRWAIRRVLKGCDLATSDSAHMAARMKALGAREVMVFPFGLEAMPPAPPPKSPWRFYANRGLEPIYRPFEVLALFAGIARRQPEARLVVANDGSLLEPLQHWVRQQGLQDAVEFVGRLAPEAQADHYAQAQWYLSLPASDAVAVSVLEAMAHGCIPLLSDLPANRELLIDGENGLLLADGRLPDAGAMAALLARAGQVAEANRRWVAGHAMFDVAIEGLLARLSAGAPAR